MEPIVTNVFPKQPREVRWFSISFADLLAAYNDTPRVNAPIEFVEWPAETGAIVLVEQVFNPATGLLNILVGEGLTGTTYLVTMLLHTVSGQRLEHQVRVKVKEETK
jgi:hypothetical protein